MSRIDFKETQNQILNLSILLVWSRCLLGVCTKSLFQCDFKSPLTVSVTKAFGPFYWLPVHFWYHISTWVQCISALLSYHYVLIFTFLLLHYNILHQSRYMVWGLCFLLLPFPWFDCLICPWACNWKLYGFQFFKLAEYDGLYKLKIKLVCGLDLPDYYFEFNTNIYHRFFTLYSTYSLNLSLINVKSFTIWSYYS